MTEPIVIDGATLHHGDCRMVLKAMADCSVDSIVTDPPYELGFMGKAWDATGIANDVAMWSECLRVLKPGGHLLAFSGSRTYHRMTCAIEDAGFEVRDQIMWIYGSGFPKSLDVSKAIDKAAGVPREVVGKKTGRASTPIADLRGGNFVGTKGRIDCSAITAPATEEANQWDGWGTALKPAHEPICVARKPLIGTVAANIIAHGTGGLHIDACRVESTGESRERIGEESQNRRYSSDGATNFAAMPGVRGGDPSGRWPANVIHDGSDEVLDEFAKYGDRGAFAPVLGTEPSSSTKSVFGQIDRQASNAFHGDTGTAARFFYCAKASREDRNEGAGGSNTPVVETNATMREREIADWSTRNGNFHPTVKPTELMKYLCRLVTPPGGTVLDIFMGSGSTGKAAVLEGFKFIGIDLTPEYVSIAAARIQHANSQPVQERLFA